MYCCYTTFGKSWLRSINFSSQKLHITIAQTDNYAVCTHSRGALTHSQPKYYSSAV